MVNTYGTPSEKVTFNMPVELKAKITALKEELDISFSAIYNEAIASYIKQKELEKWHRGVEMALSDREYRTQLEEWGSQGEELHEY